MPVKKTEKPTKTTVKFPRVTLEEAMKVPLAIKEKNGGNPWATEEVAKAVEMGPKTNPFFYLAAGARDYGLTTGSRDSARFELTALGRDIVYAPDAQAELQKKREAFLRVEPFRKVLEYYKSSDLPEMKYLRNTLEREFKIEPEDHEEFSRLFRENCTYLGIQSGDSAAASNAKPGGETGANGDGSVRPATVTLAEPEKGKEGPIAFIIMPFQERDDSHPKGFFQEVLRSLLTPAASAAGFTVRTANRQGSDLIQSTIVRDLLDADLVIADLTEHNPNVLFELGVRIAKEKPVVLVKAEGTGRIFDVDNLLRVYEYKAQLWRTTTEKDLPALTEFIAGAWDARASEQTYMKILRPEGGGATSQNANAGAANGINPRATNGGGTAEK
jgi:hypothetical protein